jgi:hypothetical protein
MKRQIQAELQRPPQSTPPPPQARPAAKTQDEDIQIREQMATGSQAQPAAKTQSAEVAAPVATNKSSNAPPPTDTQRSGRNRRSQGKGGDEAMQARMSENRNMERVDVGHSSMHLEPDSNMGVDSHVGDSVDQLVVTSVEGRSQRESNAQGEASARSTRVSSASNTRKSVEKEQPEPLPDGQRVGAVAVQTRAYGGMPVWVRQQAQAREAAVNSNSNLPPEMRGVQPDQSNLPPEMRTADDQSNLPPEMRTANDQSNLPPEMRAVIPASAEESPLDADPSVPTAEVTPVNKTATETTGGRHIWICLCVLVLVGGAVGVALGLTSGGDGDDDDDVSTDSPTQSPTLFAVPECSGFEDIDPDIKNLDEKTFALYTDLLLPLVRKLVPEYSEPMKAQDYCSAAHLALVWLANDSLDSDYPQKVLENRFLLAFLFVEWEGYSWYGNSTGWLSESPECDWDGISCDEFGSIDELSITSQIDNRNRPDPLTIPSEIGHFMDLSKLAAIHWTRFLQAF